MRDWQREMDRQTGFYDLRHFPLSAWPPTIIRKYCPHASDHNMHRQLRRGHVAWPTVATRRGQTTRDGRYFGLELDRAIQPQKETRDNATQLLGRIQDFD